jgi:hypothetical protein
LQPPTEANTANILPVTSFISPKFIFITIANPSKSLLLSVGDDALHSLPDADVFCTLLDCFRMRVGDEYKFNDKNMGILDE